MDASIRTTSKHIAGMDASIRTTIRYIVGMGASIRTTSKYIVGMDASISTKIKYEYIAGMERVDQTFQLKDIPVLSQLMTTHSAKLLIQMNSAERPV
jgi:hypothetical protein